MNDDTPKQPEHERDGQGTDKTPDRSQPELTEETLLVQELGDTNDPKEREELEDDLEEMEDDLEDANEKSE